MSILSCCRQPFHLFVSYFSLIELYNLIPYHKKIRTVISAKKHEQKDTNRECVLITINLDFQHVSPQTLENLDLIDSV